VVKDIEKLGRKAIAVQADISKPSDIASLFETANEDFGHLDIVVSNAGKEGFKHGSEITEDGFDTMFRINCRGQLFVAQQACKHVREGGRLV
jgi:3-oxoacyl-[acyl-carrier protein] reductase